MEIKEIEEKEPLYIKQIIKRINELFEECLYTNNLDEQERIYSNIIKLVGEIMPHEEKINPPVLVEGTKEEIEQALGITLELIRND